MSGSRLSTKTNRNKHVRKTIQANPDHSGLLSAEQPENSNASPQEAKLIGSDDSSASGTVIFRRVTPDFSHMKPGQSKSDNPMAGVPVDQDHASSANGLAVGTLADHEVGGSILNSRTFSQTSGMIIWSGCLIKVTYQPCQNVADGILKNIFCGWQ
ncbi:unnamed protein product [Protopolystoma xenopodis]|uniref:Uncharacterized protein n=1 Tax=Protopolystoma xenopodis TaxID=117903 RepID=A0A448WKY2_9PLAT|nr:unnamed protein product [Protopolystoma xenopodis]